MNTAIKQPNKFSSYLIVLCVIEIPTLIGVFALGHGPEDQLGWFSAINVTVLCIAVVMVLARNFSRHTNGVSAQKPQGWRGKARSLVLGLLILGSIGVWRFVVYAWVIDTSLQRYGIDSQATITGYTLFQGNGKRETTTNSLAEATHLSLAINYDGHSSTILVNNTDADYPQLYAELSTSDRTLSVRYLRPLPGIVHITRTEDF